MYFSDAAQQKLNRRVAVPLTVLQSYGGTASYWRNPAEPLSDIRMAPWLHIKFYKFRTKISIFFRCAVDRDSSHKKVLIAWLKIKTSTQA